MGLANWEITKSTGFPTNLAINAYETVASIAGLGGLILDETFSASSGAFGGTTGKYGATMRLVSGFTRGLTKGRIRLLNRLDALVAQGSSGVGFVIFMSQADVTNTSGSCYACLLNTATWTLYKTTTGLRNLASLASSTIAPLAVIGTPLALELRWAYDATKYGGTSIALYVGAALNFTDLTPRLTYVDTSSPLTTSVGEGPCMAYQYSNGVSYGPGTFWSGVQDTISIYQWS